MLVKSQLVFQDGSTLYQILGNLSHICAMTLYQTKLMWLLTVV